MSKFLNTSNHWAVSELCSYFTTEKVLLNHVSMKKSLHSKKILKLSKSSSGKASDHKDLC